MFLFCILESLFKWIVKILLTDEALQPSLFILSLHYIIHIHTLAITLENVKFQLSSIIICNQKEMNSLLGCSDLSFVDVPLLGLFRVWCYFHSVWKYLPSAYSKFSFHLRMPLVYLHFLEMVLQSIDLEYLLCFERYFLLYL